MSTSGNARLSNTSRMRIKTFSSTLDERAAHQIWKQLEKAIMEIQKKNNSGLSFEELYRNAYTLVLHRYGERLYSGSENVVREHMLRVRDSIIDNLNNKFLSYLISCWKDHQTAMVMIRDILMYMDRIYVVQHGLDNVYKMGLRIFCQHVLRHPTIHDHFQATLLDMIRRERNGEVISKSQLRDPCKMLVDLGVNDLSVYVEDFEEIFIEQSIEFYRKESETLLAENISAPLYIKRVEERLEEEVKRVSQYLDPSTKPKIIAVLERELIERHMQTIVDMPNTGLTSMLVNDKYDEIAAMYSILIHVENGPKIMSLCISHYLREQGRNITEPNDNVSPIEYIQQLLNLRDRATVLLNEALSNQIIFRNQVNSDFEYFINLNPRSPEYLSLFIDEKLKRGTKGMADQDVDIVFDKCIVLFRYLLEKDMFERYYKQHLAKRLLLGKSQSDDQEKSMISKLMIECGGVFTNKLEGMFRDMAVSKTLMEDFVRIPYANVGLELCMRVLTSGLWPTQTVTQNVDLPIDISNAFERYKAFYLERHNGRKIILQVNNGQAELLATFYGQVGSSSGTPILTTGVSGSPDNALDHTSAFLPRSSTGSSGTGTDTISLSTTTHLISQAISASCGSSGLPGSPGINGHHHQRQQHTLSATTLPNSKTSVRKHLLQVSTYQMIILMKFNQRERYTYEELARETGIPDRDLIRSLMALALAKPTQRFLCKEPRSKEVDPQDVFYVNDSFTSKHYKIKVTNITVKETEPEQQETRALVDENRRFAIDATIVRVMKARKTLSHNELLAEVVEKLMNHFKPTPPVIKSRIEALIEREFIARCPEDKRVYKYLT